MINIRITQRLKAKCPQLRLGCLSCSIEVSTSDGRLIEVISKTLTDIQPENIQMVSLLPGIAASKRAYRALGKDPSRYRPSAEALMRRVVNGKGLYQVNNAVDILNLVSLQSGFSIGGYDANKIVEPVAMRTGQKDEPYAAIGRGRLNIENLPVLQDTLGVFGSPTSDSTRTMVTDECNSFLMVFFDFESEAHLEQALEKSKDLLTEHAGGQHFESSIIS